MVKKILTIYERKMFSLFVWELVSVLHLCIVRPVLTHSTYKWMFHIHVYSSTKVVDFSLVLLFKCIYNNTFFFKFTVAIVTSPVTCLEMLHWSNSSHGSFNTGWWGVPRREASYSHLPQTYVWSWRTLQLSETLCRGRNRRFWRFIGMLTNIFVI